MFCCCGNESDASPNSSVPFEPPRDDPVVIEPLPDMTTLTATGTSTNQTSQPANPFVDKCSSSESARQSEKAPQINSGSLDQHKAALNGMERVDTQGAMDECLRKRAYILSISDSELQLLPVLFIESFYSCLSPGEVVQLEQRLCDLKTKCILSNQQQLSKQLSTASENFMRTLRPQFSIRNENGFWLDDEIGVQSGFDVRDLILTANDEEIATISEQVLSIIEPYLSIAELEDVRERIELVNISLRAQKEVQGESNRKDDPVQDTLPQLDHPLQQLPVNSDIYHLTTAPSVSVKPPTRSQEETKDDSASGMSANRCPPKICISDADAIQFDSSVEETVQKIVGDVLENI